MSFVTTRPEALMGAAGSLQGIGSTLTAQNAAAAAPTTGVVPAAADEVSALQAAQFSSYGTLYQQISAQAAAIHQMFVNTLSTSAGSYGATEAANSTAAGSSGSGLPGLLALLTGSASPSSGASGIFAGLSGNGANALTTQIGNFGSAASDMAQLGSAGIVTQGPEALLGQALGAGLFGGSGEAVLMGAAGPAGPASLAAAPVSAGLGQASSVGGLSVPSGWPGAAAPAAGATPATLTGAGWTAASPQHPAVTTVPAGMGSLASAGRGGFGFGTPRYGVKPTVMPRPAVV